MKFNATAEISVFLWALLSGCHSYAAHYKVQVYQRMVVYSESQPQNMMMLAQGGMELSSHTMNFSSRLPVTGELATITLAPAGAVAPEPEPNCIAREDVLFLRPKGNGRCESNIHCLSKVRPMPFNVQAAQQKKDGADDQEVFQSVLNPEIMRQSGFKRSVFTSGPLLVSGGTYLHSIQELRGPRASVDGQLKPEGEFVNLRSSRDRRITLQQLVRELINSGNLEAIESGSQLSDDLFHVIYNSDVDICLIKSPEGKRSLKIVVQDHEIESWPFVIIITGEPENQMASSGENMGFSLATNFIDEFMQAQFQEEGAPLEGQQFQLTDRLVRKGGTGGKFDPEF